MSSYISETKNSTSKKDEKQYIHLVKKYIDF